jgi:hypothetical protein
MPPAVTMRNAVTARRIFLLGVVRRVAASFSVILCAPRGFLTNQSMARVSHAVRFKVSLPDPRGIHTLGINQFYPDGVQGRIGTADVRPDGGMERERN